MTDHDDAACLRALIETLWGDYDDEPQMIGSFVVAVSFILSDGESRVHTFYDGRRAEARGLAMDLVDDLAAGLEEA